MYVYTAENEPPADVIHLAAHWNTDDVGVVAMVITTMAPYTAQETSRPLAGR